MSVQISHSGIIEDKLRALDNAEEDRNNELEEYTDETQEWHVRPKDKTKIDPIVYKRVGAQSLVADTKTLDYLKAV